jgi:hypothetical protein
MSAAKGQKVVTVQLPAFRVDGVHPGFGWRGQALLVPVIGFARWLEYGQRAGGQGGRAEGGQACDGVGPCRPGMTRR